LRELKRKTNLLLLTPNGWTFQSFEPFMDNETKRKNYYWHDRHEFCISSEMIDYFEEKNLDNYFALFWCQEVHPPFFHPNWKGMEPGKINKSPETPDPPTRRKMALEWIDHEIIGKLLKQNYDELVVTADHPLKHPGNELEFVKKLEEGKDPEEFQVFIATDI